MSRKRNLNSKGRRVERRKDERKGLHLPDPLHSKGNRMTIPPQIAQLGQRAQRGNRSA